MSANHIGSRIKARRKELGLSMREMGSVLDVSQQSICKWEHGTSLPRSNKISDIASTLKMTVAELTNQSGGLESVAVQQMTCLRDHFAGLAMAALISADREAHMDIPSHAYSWADAMLEERLK